MLDKPKRDVLMDTWRSSTAFMERVQNKKGTALVGSSLVNPDDSPSKSVL